MKPPLRPGLALAAFLLAATLPVQAAPAMPEIHAPAGPAFELPADADPETVPLRWADGRVFLQASINGQNAGWFLVSTGMPTSWITSSVARSLDLTSVSSGLRAPSTPAPRQRYRADVLRIGGASASDVVLQVVDYPKMSRMLTDMYGEGVAGELGWDLLKTLPFILDEPGLQFRWQRKAVPGNDAVRMPLSDPKGVPMIEIKLGGTCTVSALLGSAWASQEGIQRLGIRRKFLHQHAAELWNGREAHLKYGAGFGLQDDDPLPLDPSLVHMLEVDARWLSVECGPLRTETIAEISSPTHADFGDVQAGYALFRCAHMLFDGPAKAVWITPAKSSPVIKLLEREAGRKSPAFITSALSSSIKDNFPDEVRAAITAGADFKQPLPPSPHAALAYACSLNSLAAATALLEAGAPVNPPPGQSLPLAETVWDPKLVRLLLNKGADPNRANDLGATPLMAAARSGVPGAVEMLGPKLRLPKDPKDVGPVFSIAIYGQTPAVAMDMLKRIPKESLPGLKWPTMLETTLLLGYPESAEWVLDTGGTKLAREGGQLQPLLAAILPTRIGKSDAVRLKLVKRLLAAGADPNAGRKGVSPLLLAARYGSDDIVKALLAAGAKATATDHQGRHALHRAAAANQAVEVIAPLFKSGLDLDEVDPETDLSPLATYAMHGNIKACAALLESGAKADVQSMFSPSSLAMAAQSPDTREEDALAVARLLLEHGAKPGANPVNETVPPPLYGAILTSRASLIQALVDSGAPVEMKFEDGTPLGWACAVADTATVKTLLDLGADPKLLDQRGVSPLARAAAEGKTDNMACLMNRGVPADGGNPQAVSPLWLAVSCGQTRAVRLLLAAGANLDTRDPVRKSTPLEAAHSKRDQVMVDLLGNALRKR